MRVYALSAPNLLDPQWFNKVRNGRHPAVVAADESVTVAGVVLRFNGEAPTTDTHVQVWLSGSGFFICATNVEIEAEIQARREVEVSRAESRRQHLNRLRADAEVFNARITLPVRWDVGIKDVLSGLSPASWGNGRNRATVDHVYLLEPLEAGRLKRRAGDFLCTSANGSNGKRWSTTVARGLDGDGRPFQPKVTCKSCLAQSERWKQANT